MTEKRPTPGDKPGGGHGTDAGRTSTIIHQKPLDFNRFSPVSPPGLLEARLREVYPGWPGFTGPKTRTELKGPCPLCGGEDRFWANLKDGLFGCRSCPPGTWGSVEYILAHPPGVERPSQPAERPYPPPSPSKRVDTEAEAVALLHQRGLRDETIAHFQITADLDKQAWRYPVLGLDGRLVRHRLKSFDPAHKPKYQWGPGEEMPSYNIQAAIGQKCVWLPGGEPNVWLLHQAGVPAAWTTQGERNDPVALLQELKGLGVEEVRVVLDNDDAGRAGSLAILQAAQQLGLGVKAFQLPDYLGHKADAGDLYLWCNGDDSAFCQALEELPAVERVIGQAPPEVEAAGYALREEGLGMLRKDGGWSIIIPTSVQIVELQQEAEQEAHTTYVLEVSTPKGSRTLTLVANDLADPRTTRAAFLGLGIAPRPRMEAHIPSALLATSQGYPTIQLYHRTGWAGGRYIAPGREPEGVKVELPSRVYLSLTGGELGAGLEALEGLIEALPAPITTIGIAHAFLPPLARIAGLGRYKNDLHITGATGTLKTSFCCVLMALYAGKDWEMQPVLKWGEGATNNAILAHAAHTADALLLIDNFKPTTGGGVRSFIGLLHNIIEGADRERLSRASRLIEARQLHAWPLTTGEDIPQEDAASIARLLVVRFDWKGGHNEPLARAQELAYHLPAVTRSWLTYLEGHPDWAREQGASLTKRRGTWADWIQSKRPKAVNALRLATSLALQEIVWEAMSACPELAGITTHYQQAHREGLEAVALEMAGITAGALGANRWLEALGDLIQSGRITFRSKDDLDPALFGWQDQDCYYLLPTTVHQEVFEALRKAGQPLAISTTALYKQLEGLEAIASSTEDGRLAVVWVGGKARRVLQLWRAAVDGDQEGKRSNGEIKF